MSIEIINEKTILNLILTNRLFLMGVAMILVIIYHLFCWVYNPIGPLNIGYVGVDIFLFLSGLGLSYSYEKNSIIQFYHNRIRRIYPIYLFSVLATYLLYRPNWSLFDLLANVLSLGIYTKGGINRYDWYLESLLSLYVLFPLFYYYGKIKMGGVAILFSVTIVLLFNYDIPWWYDCILGRLPIFLYGIIFKYCLKSYKTISIIGILLYLPCYKYVSPFLASSGLTIPLILSCLLLIVCFPPRLTDTISYIGKHSLEFYIANLFVYWFYESTNYTTIERLILFIFIQIIATIVLIRLYRFLCGIKISLISK